VQPCICLSADQIMYEKFPSGGKPDAYEELDIGTDA